MPPRSLVALWICVWIAAPLLAIAQPTRSPIIPDSAGTPLSYGFDVGTGVSRIETQGGGSNRYFMFSLMPEFYFDEYGLGFLVNLRFDTNNQELREEDFNDVQDFLGLVRFFQYRERDELGWYGRFGMLEDALLGYGQLVNYYDNTTRLDDPRRGLEGTFTREQYAFEAIWADLASPGVYGFRGSYRPYAADSLSRLRSMSVGVSIGGDLESEGAFTNPLDPGQPYSITPPPVPLPPLDFDLAQGIDDGALSMLVLDVGYPLSETDDATLLAYAELGKIWGYGSGVNVGGQATWKYPGRSRLRIRGAIQFIGKEYLPNYFGPTYEFERIRRVTIPIEQGDDLNATQSKRNRLVGRDRSALGTNLSLAWRYQRDFRLTTTYEHIVTERDGGTFHLDAQLSTPKLPYYIRFGYDRININTPGDIVRPESEDSLFRVAFAYRFFTYFMLGFDLRQSFEPTFTRGVIDGFSKRNRIEPYISLVLQ